MSVLPAKLLKVDVSNISPSGYWNIDDGSGDPFIGSPYQWDARLSVTVQSHSSNITNTPFAYDGYDIKVGDWISTGLSGVALKIISITNADSSIVNVVLEDVERYNTFSDATGSGNGVFGEGTGYLFEVDSDGLPILIGVEPNLLAPQYQSDLISRFIHRNTKNKYISMYKQNHTFVVGQPIRYDINSEIEESISDINANRTIGVITSVNIPGPGWFTYKPIGNIILVSLPGNIGDIIYVDISGNLTTSAPLENILPVYIKISNTEGLLLNQGVAGTASNSDITMKYVGAINANIGVLPSNPEEGEFIRITASGNFNNQLSYTANIGDLLVYLDTQWIKIDNQSSIINTNDGIGKVISGNTTTLSLDFASLPIISSDTLQYVPVYDTGNSIPARVAISDIQKVSIRTNSNSTITGTQPEINFIAGTGISLTATNDMANGKIDLEITNSSSGSSASVLQTPSDGSFTNPKIPGGKLPAILSWVAGSTSVSDALDDLNETLGLLIPSVPPDLSTKTLSISGTSSSRNGSNFLLTNGYTNNIGNTVYNPGDQVSRLTSTSASSNLVSNFGSGNSGILSSIVNDNQSGNIVLDAALSNVGTNGSLNITRNSDYPLSSPGFWKDLDANITSSVPVGVNSFRMLHSETGGTNITYFVRDDLVTNPTVSAVDAIAGSTVNTTSSSSIPHYSTGTTLAVDATLTNLAGQTYLSSNIAHIQSTTSFGSIVQINPGQFGIPSIINANQTPVSLSSAIFTISGNIHTSGKVSVGAKNCFGDSAIISGGPTILVMSGNYSLTDLSVPVTGLGSSPVSTNAGRIKSANGDNPSDVISLTNPDWVSTDGLMDWDAAISGGVLKNDVTNYSIGYLPIGPNLNIAGRVGAQYITYMFRRSSISQFKINITGGYAGLWVKLPGLTGLNNTVNGWWTMNELYAGSGVPGSGSNGAGCAVGTIASGSSGSYTATFGTQSSTNSTNNIILVRIRLNAGQQITSLSFSN